MIFTKTEFLELECLSLHQLSLKLEQAGSDTTLDGYVRSLAIATLVAKKAVTLSNHYSTKVSESIK